MFGGEPAGQRRSGWRVILAGTGGQGVITAARLLTEFAVEEGHHVVSSQLHGMAQRGGAVQSAVMIDCGNSPAPGRGRADLVVGLEPVETARAVPLMSDRTVVFMNTVPVIPYVLAQNYALGEGRLEYPPVEKLAGVIHEVTGSLVTLDATALAREAGSVKALNLVMLGCLFGSGHFPFSPERFLTSAMKRIPPALAEVNRRAFLAGVEFGRNPGLIEESPCL